MQAIPDFNATHKRQGFNLVEAAIVLGVVGLVIGGIWVAASSVSSNQKINDTAAGYMLACDRATSIFSASLAPTSGYVVMNPADLIKAGIFPASWVNTNTNVITPPLGEYSYTFWMDGSQGVEYNGEMRLNLKSLTEAQCNQLLPKFSRASADLIREIDVTAGTNTSLTPPYSGSFFTACAGSNSIEIQFRCTARR